MSAEAPMPPAGSGDGRTASFWTRDRVAAALGGGPRGGEPLGRVWTDTRTVQPGDLFVALTGPNFDGHEFLAAAEERGAAGVVISAADRAAGLRIPVYVVRDTLSALGALARARRRAWGGPVVGVVGSNGKTSTRELLRAALSATRRVHASAANFNNLVGVPRTLLDLPDDAEVAVVEMGTNQPGEIAALRAIAEPDVVVVTSIAEEHLEGLGDLDGVMREELSACDGVALVIVPAGQPAVVAEARKRADRVVSAGLDAGDLRAERWHLDDEGFGVAVVAGTEVRPPARGRHQLENAMLVMAAASACGVSAADAARGLATARLPGMRGSVEQLGRLTLINDSYNANPHSMLAALELLTRLGAAAGRQRVAVLGTMREMGVQTHRVHDAVAAAALASPVEVLVGIGEMGDALARAGGAPSRVIPAADPTAAWAALAPRLAPNAVILLKASRGVRLEQLVPAIAAWAASA
ncbi:MAG TPA: UDP-N-acetylmuramoyl-tripeptide--D-alanyl-D-alanine ligase [Gemmatimonadaceae bacterium]|nr:UDP-N-acetylmuramoyl-tripeptide--D-alanyl-D-alanine ligase [Gemmatimonadaceae bacterium]